MKVKKNIIIVFDFSGTLVRMRPPKLLLSRKALINLSKSYKMVIITGATKAETTNILKKLDIVECFSLVISKEASIYSKPNPKLFDIVKTEYKDSVAIYLGDSKSDQTFAGLSQVPFLLVDNNYPNKYKSMTTRSAINFIIKNFPDNID